ncbi:MAG: hypothetical protein OXM56_11130 [Gammaproteobacteria bacterium]|nr:hypothetical protein [Gammaproteobacteria bacterium]
MASLFEGTEDVICRTLGVQRRADLKQPSASISRLSEAAALDMISAIHGRLVANYAGRPRSLSKELWRLRRATKLQDHNPNKETLLEKAVANLAANDHMPGWPGWFNQCPVASGIVDPYADRRRCVDLIHCEEETVRLIELKWSGDTPLSALVQVLEYGLAFVFAWVRQGELRLENRYLMKRVRQVALEVLGSREFFANGAQLQLFETVSRALGRFTERETGGTVSMSLQARSFPVEFRHLPFANGSEVKAMYGGAELTDVGRIVREAFSNAEQIVDTSPRRTVSDGGRTERFLPGVPAAEIERALMAAPGNEIGRRKFDHPESSAALAVNAFGFFLHRPAELPALPGCEQAGWPAHSVSVETAVRFPWRGGRHPVPDCLIATRSALIGVESKRYEPFRPRKAPSLSKAYWRDVWGSRMTGYAGARDALRENPRLYSCLDAAQLVKHAFALRTEVHRRGPHAGLRPMLLYVYAEPEVWVRTGRQIGADTRATHLSEIESFAQHVAGDEVKFVSCSYRRLLETWLRVPGGTIRDHAQAVIDRFSP